LLATVEIAEKVIAFDSFTADNDPHGEHDFGAFEHDGQKIFWKIDCYADASRTGTFEVSSRRKFGMVPPEVVGPIPEGARATAYVAGEHFGDWLRLRVDGKAVALSAARPAAGAGLFTLHSS